MPLKAHMIATNHIIKTIYCEQNNDQMRLKVLSMLQEIIPFDYGSFYLVDNTEEHFFCCPVGIGLSDEELSDYIEKYKDSDYCRFIYSIGESMVFRETDLFGNDYVHDKKETELFKRVLVMKNIRFGAQICIANDSILLGLITLLRKTDKDDFSEDEMFILELILLHLKTRLLREKRNEKLEKFLPMHNINSLTAREQEVYRSLVEGKHSNEICSELKIAPNTLKKHTMNIYRKLGVNSRWELFCGNEKY